MKNKTIIFISILILISLFVYRRWLSFDIFAAGDWGFLSKESLISNFYPSVWIDGLDNINFIIWRYPLDFIAGIFGYLGFASNISEKFLYFWQIIFLAPIGSFLLIRKILRSNLPGFIGSLVFSYNTYFLSIDTQGHELLTVAFIWSIFAFLSFIHLLETKNKFFIPATALLLFIVGSYDLRSLYVTFGILFLYVIYNQLVMEMNWKANLKNNIFLFISIIFILILLNLYWILPLIYLNQLIANPVLSRGILATNFYNLQNVTALFFPFWTGAEPTWFFVQKIPIYFWFYPILAFLGLILNRKNKMIVFFGMLALIGIFLAKQDFAPFGQIYIFLYTHLPGFNAFREASKFYFLIAISYSVLIGAFSYFVFNLKIKRQIKYLIIFLITFLPLWNTLPMITGTIKTMFIPKRVSVDISKVNSYFVNIKNYSRIFWINSDFYRLTSSNNHPEIPGSIATLQQWQNTSNIKFDSKIDLNSSNVDAEKLKTFFASEMGRRLLSQGSYGYVAVNTAKNEFTDANIIPQTLKYLGEYLYTVKFLEPINLNTKDILVFKNKDAKPHLYLTYEKESLEKDVPYKKLNFQKLNNSEYKINLQGIKKHFYLNFTDNYHPDWIIYTGNFNFLNVIFGTQPKISGSEHFKNAAGFNGFEINPKEICNINNDEDCTVYLLFRPQAYLYLGLIISGITLTIVLCLLPFLYKKKYEKIF